MHVIRRSLISSLALLSLTTACGQHDASSEPRGVHLPRIQEVGSRAHEYTSFDQLAALSSALVIATPTGQQSSKPLPTRPGDNPSPAPTVYLEMHVDRVLSGVVPASTVQVVSLGPDESTGQPALLTGGQFLMYLAPAMYGPGDDAGGYVVAGGPAGVYASHGPDGQFVKIDELDPQLPPLITSTSDLPTTSHTTDELLAIGPQ